MKLCKDCKHLSDDSGKHCTRVRWTDPVTGDEKRLHLYASIERDVTKPVLGCTSNDPCGPDGKHWVEAPPKPAPKPAPLPWWKRAFCRSNTQ